MRKGLLEQIKHKARRLLLRAEYNQLKTDLRSIYALKALSSDPRLRASITAHRREILFHLTQADWAFQHDNLDHASKHLEPAKASRDIALNLMRARA